MRNLARYFLVALLACAANAQSPSSILEVLDDSKAEAWLAGRDPIDLTNDYIKLIEELSAKKDAPNALLDSGRRTESELAMLHCRAVLLLAHTVRRLIDLGLPAASDEDRAEIVLVLKKLDAKLGEFDDELGHPRTGATNVSHGTATSSAASGSTGGSAHADDNGNGSVGGTRSGGGSVTQHEMEASALRDALDSSTRKFDIKESASIKIESGAGLAR